MGVKNSVDLDQFKDYEDNTRMCTGGVDGCLVKEQIPFTIRVKSPPHQPTTAQIPLKCAARQRMLSVGHQRVASMYANMHMCAVATRPSSICVCLYVQVCVCASVR